jgi:predicted nucleic acid-binding protein
LSQLGDGRWRPNLTVAVALEYEAVLKRDCREFSLTEEEIDEALEAISSQAGLHRLYFLWRPAAADPNDDLVMEAAIASHSDFIITFNKRDFLESRKFGIQCLTPKEFLILMEEML